MKTITAKSLEIAIDQASEELGISKEELLYEILEEKKGLFSKKVVVAFYDTADVIEFAQNYITNIIHDGLGLEVSLKAFYRNGLIKILIETDHNSLLIGRNGQTLQALNELVKLAISSKFKRKFRILLDIGDYKDKKYRMSLFSCTLNEQNDCRFVKQGKELETGSTPLRIRDQDR